METTVFKSIALTYVAAQKISIYYNLIFDTIEIVVTATRIVSNMHAVIMKYTRRPKA